jgi:acyl-CoA reductase-like NAD-dependent aldehyde dehydrogenase
MRIDVKKTYKLYINGAFPRSESGRVFEVKNSKGEFIANPCLASRKDLRDAVVAARAAQSGWAKSTAYLRGQILYRIAEMAEGRKEQLIDEVSVTEKVTKAVATKLVETAIDRWVWYAGWSDKLSSIFGATNQVSGPYYNFTIPEPQGVITVTADSLLTFVESVGAAVCSGNSVIALVGGGAAIPVMTFAEVISTSDVPNGVINILTGSLDELTPWAASHMDVDGLDITAISQKKRAELIAAAAENLKRVHAFDKGQSPTRVIAFMEAKTVWHPIGV